MGGDTQLGRDYVLHEEIGSGALAVVHRATSRLGGPALAAKVLRPEFSADRRVRELFVREEVALRDLHHGSIVGVHDFVVEGGRMALLMEYVDGPNLRAHLASHGGRLPAAEVISIGAQLAGALAYAHAQGVVHLDVKPENVLVRSSSPTAVKLGDFGVAGILAEAGAAAGGTVQYSAPEVARGGATTAAADMYSLGVLLAELATGRRPTPGRTDLSALPAALHDVVADCLDAGARNRPSARSVAAQLRSADTSFGPSVPDSGGSSDPLRTRLRRPAATPPPAVPSKSHRRRRAVAIGIGASLLLGVIIGLTVNASANDYLQMGPARAPATQSTPASEASTSERAGATDNGDGATDNGEFVPIATDPVVAVVPARANYAAHLADDAGTLYIAVRDVTVIAYICDGRRLEAWFKGTANSGRIRLTSKAGGRINATYDADTAVGTVAVGGAKTEFTLLLASGKAGLYKSLTKVNGARIKGSWIVLADGTQVGVLTINDIPRPAPSLDTANGTAVVKGEAVDTTRVDVETGAGFN